MEHGWDDEQTTAIQADFPSGRDDGQGSLDVVYRHEEGKEAFLDGVWRAVDVCTRNRIYGLDARMQCIVVIDRQSGEQNTEHKLLGASLVGGQTRDDKGTLVAHPLPEVGMAAVFEVAGDRRRYIETSAVTRVIIRQRIVRLTQSGPQWNDLSGSFQRPKQG